MRFIGDILDFLKTQHGQLARKAGDFRSIMEYTAFFVVIIYILTS